MRSFEANIFLKTENESVYKGVVWPGVTTWFHESTQSYCSGEFNKFFNLQLGLTLTRTGAI